MIFFSLYDFISPTNPFISLLFGLIFILIAAIFVWKDTKKPKAIIMTVSTGILFSIVVIYLLHLVGYYH